MLFSTPLVEGLSIGDILIIHGFPKDMPAICGTYKMSQIENTTLILPPPGNASLVGLNCHRFPVICSLSLPWLIWSDDSAPMYCLGAGCDICLLSRSDIEAFSSNIIAGFMNSGRKNHSANGDLGAPREATHFISS